MNSAGEQKDVGLVLCVGVDPTSRGGIASVVQAYLNAHEHVPSNFRFKAIKSSFYEERGWWCEPLIFARAVCQILWYCLFEKVVLVHIHTSHKYSFARKSICVFLCRILRKKTILHIHASNFEGFFLSRSFFVNRWVGYVLRKCDLVLVLCRDWQHKLTRAFPGVRVDTLANPAAVAIRSSQRERGHLPDGRLTLLFVGYLRSSKGIEDIVELARLLKNEGRNRAMIIVAGKGAMERWLLDAIRTEKLEEYLEFKGWVYGEAKERLFLSADVFLLPSHAEGMPMAILEAMSYGLPILATRIAGIPDIVRPGYNGYLYRPGDVAGFLTGVKKVMGDSALRDRLGANSLTEVRQYKQEIIFAKLTDFYSRATNGSVRRSVPMPVA